MSAFPSEAFAVLVEALKSKTFSLKAVKAAMTVVEWAIDSFGDLFPTSTAGTLSTVAVLSDDEALGHFERMTGDVQASVDPAIVKAIVSFLLTKLLERLAK